MSLPVIQYLWVYFLPEQWHHITVTVVYCHFLLFNFFSTQGWLRPLILIGYFIGSTLLSSYIIVIFQYLLHEPYQYNGSVSLFPVLLLPAQWRCITIALVFCYFSLFSFGFSSHLSAKTLYYWIFNRKYFSEWLYECYNKILDMWALLAQWWDVTLFSVFLPAKWRRITITVFSSLGGLVQPLILIGYFIRSTFMSNYITVILQYWIWNPRWRDAQCHTFHFFPKRNGAVSQ